MASNTKKTISLSVESEAEKDRLNRIAAEHGLVNAAGLARMLLYEGLIRKKWTDPGERTDGTAAEGGEE